VQVLFPKISNDMSMQAPTSKWLTVVGGVSLGGELDQHFGLMHLMTLSEILGVATGAQGIRVQFDDPYVANLAIRQIGNQLDQPMYMSSWYHSHGHLYQDIQLVRTVVYLSLVLLITVACFNIVSSLVMSVNEKQAEIAILKSMGASDTFILHVFVAQGLINGLIGTTVGCLLGCILALNITDWIAALESKSGVELLSGDIYFVDFLPSLLHYNEVALTGLIALSLSVLATLYPARKAAKLPPAQGLA
jgi:lipoprotein-releasing system permease protein